MTTADAYLLFVGIVFLLTLLFVIFLIKEIKKKVKNFDEKNKVEKEYFEKRLNEKNDT